MKTEHELLQIIAEQTYKSRQHLATIKYILLLPFIIAGVILLLFIMGGLAL